MKRVTTAIVAGSVAAVLLVPASSRSQPHHQRLPSEIQNAQLRNLIGITVENADGEKLGKIKNLAIDLQSGQAKYALISSGGIIGVGTHLRIVPAAVISTATAKKEIASLDISKSRWAKAPLFKKSDLTALNEPPRADLIAKFYAHSIHADSPGPHNYSSGDRQTDKVATRTGDSMRAAKTSAPFQLATDIVGKDVVNRQEQSLGAVSDLLLDLTGQKPAFAVISITRALKRDQSFAVPLRSLTSGARDKLVLDANHKMFEESQPFDQKAWQSASASNAGVIYRFQPR